MEVTLEQIKEGLESKEFEPYLQPKYSLRENRIVGAEALARWCRDGKVIMPCEFIPIFEQNHCLYELDRYIWEYAARLLASWTKAGIDLIPISVNVAISDFEEIDVPAEFERLISEYNIPSQYLKLEIKEYHYINNIERVHGEERRLRNRGFRIVIDDFGSGSSSLAVLKDVDADVIKFNIKMLSAEAGNEEKSGSIIKTVSEMAQSLGLKLVTECVETREQLDLLKENHCDYIQGYYFYHPMPVRDFEEILKKQSERVANQEDKERKLARECLQEGRDMLKYGRYEDAASLINRAITITNKDEDIEFYCLCLNAIGAVNSMLGDPLMAMECYLDGLTEALKVDFSVAISKFYNNIGSEYQELGDYHKAIKYFEYCLKEFARRENQLDSEYQLRVFVCHYNLADSYINIGEYEKAKEHIEKCKVLLHHPDNIDMAISLKIIECSYYLETAEKDVALQLYEEAITEIFEMEDKSDIWNDMNAIFDIAETFRKYEDMEKLLLFMDEQVEALTDELRSINLFIEIKEQWIRYYELIGEMDNLHRAEMDYAKLCRKFMELQKKAKITNLDTQIKMREQERERINKQINRDELTKVGNRYKLETDFKRLLEIDAQTVDEERHSIGVGILDVDYFKEINDHYGHLVGDDYLKNVATTLNRLIREVGGVYRYGGDEFVLLLNDGSKEFLDNIGQSIQEEINMLNLENECSPYGKLTVSQGYISTNLDENADIWQILSKADKKLYEVKRNGKNGYQYSVE
ncbi:MAG: EAL domain-containing protein [Lachnospiraceae bacterium]|nr:EAL domain-containing protein [Lachnospiraceae bacterium]